MAQFDSHASESPEALYTELEAALCYLTVRMPQPGAQEFLSRCVDVAKRLQAAGETSACIRNRLSRDPGGVDSRKFKALVACLLFRIDACSYPWEQMIDVCGSSWPEWGYPYLTAARELLKNARGSGYDLGPAKRLIEQANRRVSIAEFLLLRTLEELLRPLVDTRPGEDLVFATRWLALHRPILSNLASWADAARRAGDEEAREEAVRTAIWILGSEPTDWPIEMDFLDLSSAGSLCIHIGQSESRDRSADRGDSWSRQAIAFLNESLTADDSGEPRLYARIRLVTQYAHLLGASEAQMDDEEFDRLYETACRSAVELTRLVKGEEKDLVYQASRDLAKIIAAAARRSKRRNDDPENTSRLIERAYDHYRSWAQLAVGAKREIAERRTREFLLQNLNHPVAVSLLQQEDTAFARIAAKLAAGRRKEALKGCLAALDDASEYESRLQYAWVLDHCVRLLGDDSSSSPRPTVIVRAAEALRGLAGLLVDDCSESIKQGDLERARRSLSAATTADAFEPTVLHLRARIGLRDGRPQDVARDLSDLLREREGLRQNPYLVGALVRALKRSGEAVIEPGEIRELTGHTALAENPYALQDLVLWTLRVGKLDSWADDLRRGVRRHPDAEELVRIPAAAFAYAPERAPTIVERTIELVGRQDGDFEWCSRMLAELPNEYFLADGSIEVLIGVLGVSRVARGTLGGYMREVAKGLSRAMIHQWPRSDPFVLDVATRVTRLLPQREDRVRFWTQLLGTNRHIFESVVATRERDRLATVSASLATTYDPWQWVSRLESFLYGMRERVAQRRDTVHGNGLDGVVQHCVESARRFRPERPDSGYWTTLQTLVEASLPAELPPDSEAHAIARAWTRVHRGIQTVVLRRLLPVLTGAVHGFKNDLRYRLRRAVGGAESVPVRWREELGAVLTRTTRFVALHRWPRLRIVDFGAILEYAAYRPPFTRTGKSEPPGPRIWATRPDEQLPVEGDFELLAEACRELMANSLHKVAEQGEYGWVWASVGNDNESALLRVTDSAGGCDESLLASMNDPNEYTVFPDTRTGIGVSICRRIAEGHDGSLTFSFDGAMDHGLVAELRIPLAQAEETGVTDPCPS